MVDIRWFLLKLSCVNQMQAAHLKKRARRPDSCLLRMARFDLCCVSGWFSVNVCSGVFVKVSAWLYLRCFSKYWWYKTRSRVVWYINLFRLVVYCLVYICINFLKLLCCVNLPKKRA